MGDFRNPARAKRYREALRFIDLVDQVELAEIRSAVTGVTGHESPLVITRDRPLGRLVISKAVRFRGDQIGTPAGG